MLLGTGLGRTNNGAEADMTKGKWSEFGCTLLAKHRRAVFQHIRNLLIFGALTAPRDAFGVMP